MRAEIISSHSDFFKLKSSWNAVYQADPEAQFFLSWRWLAEVFSKTGGGWFVIAIERDRGLNNHVAFFPLLMQTAMSNSSYTLYNEIRVAGRLTWSDYSGFLCHPDYQQQAIPLLAKKLKQLHWRKLYLKNLLISDKRLKLFTGQFDRKTFDVKYLERISRTDKVNQLVCPYVQLPGDFDEYLVTKLSSNSRQKIRRFLRKVENSDEFKITLSTPQTQDRDVDILIRFWTKKWVKRKDKQIDNLAKKYRQILQYGLACDSLLLPVLWRGEQPMGALGIFIDHDKKSLLYFVAGRDERYNNPPPGIVLHAYSLRWAIQNGFQYYDFLRGDESFKYSFGAVDRIIHYPVISTRSGKNLNKTLDPVCIKEAVKKVTAYQQAGQTSKALHGFDQILEVVPDHSVALRRYARLLYQIEKFEKSEKVYKKLSQIDPDNSEVWRGLGKSLLALNRFGQAEAVIRKSISLARHNLISKHYYLARSLQKQKKTNQAFTEYSALLKLKPHSNWDMKKQKQARQYLQEHKHL